MVRIKKRLPWLVIPTLLALLCSSIALADVYTGLSGLKFLGNGTTAWYWVGSSTPSWYWLGSSALYTTSSGRTATSLAIVFAVIVLIVLLIGIGLYVKTAATAEGISPQILIVGALVAVVIGVLGIALIVSLMMGINFI